MSVVPMPNLRRDARGHYNRAPGRGFIPRLVPAQPVPPPPPARTAPSRDLRWLCCEGACSPGQVLFAERERELRTIGYSGDSLRGSETASLTHTPHYFVRTMQMGSTVFQMWACATCGNERVYGAEEA